MTRGEERYLVEQAQADPRKFDALYLAFIQDIYRFVYYKTSQKETAEDITAQVFMQTLEHLNKFHYKPGARFSSWLYSIARNQVIDYYRRHKEPVTLDAAVEQSIPAASSDQMDKKFQQQRVQDILQLLPPDDQAILKLRLWQDKPYTEIAQIVDSNQVAVRARYSRALKKFNQLYTKRYGQTD